MKEKKSYLALVIICSIKNCFCFVIFSFYCGPFVRIFGFFNFLSIILLNFVLLKLKQRQQQRQQKIRWRKKLRVNRQNSKSNLKNKFSFELAL